ncbi:ABC transporter permease [Nocardioides gilvus]|uniref:ABC transporter permease n=1 Tax=Nocardioides gilvus TaxID=1735589 RepID=UPI000D74CF4F|nr:ABC transporter permease [Nocardioides gilvus]
MRSVVTIALNELKRYMRDRSNIFFVLIFPLLLVMLIGIQFGEGATTGRAAVVGDDSDLRSVISEELGDQEVDVSHGEWDAALEQLARGRLDVAVRVTAEAAAAHDEGREVEVEMVTGSSFAAPIVEQNVRSALSTLGAQRAQEQALIDKGVDRDRAVAALERARAEVQAPRLEVTSVDAEAQEFEGLGQFDFGAAGQLLLFVFLTTLTGASTLIQSRRERVVQRMMTTPMTGAQLIAGQTLGRWVLGAFQGAYIMVASSLLFSVSWGHVPTALVVLAVFALVGAGAAMLLGTLVDNEGAAVGIGVGLGLTLGALGGSMFPLEFFPDTMRRVANVTPHAWGYEAFAELQRRDATLVDVLPQIGVLGAMALVLVTLGAWSLRRSLQRAM